MISIAETINFHQRHIEEHLTALSRLIFYKNLIKKDDIFASLHMDHSNILLSLSKSTECSRSRSSVVLSDCNYLNCK